MGSGSLSSWVDMARGGDPFAQYNIRRTQGWQQAASGDIAGATDWLKLAGVEDPTQAAEWANWVQANPNTWADVPAPIPDPSKNQRIYRPQAPAYNPPVATTVLPTRPDLGVYAEGDPAAWAKAFQSAYPPPSSPETSVVYGTPGVPGAAGADAQTAKTGVWAPPGIGEFTETWTGLRKDPTWGPLLQSVINDSSSLGAVQKQAAALGASPEAIAYWSEMLQTDRAMGGAAGAEGTNQQSAMSAQDGTPEWGTLKSLGLDLNNFMTSAATPAEATWKDQQTALLENPQWGPLAQGVQSGTMDPGAAIKQAQALGAKPYEVDYWARLLGYNGGESGSSGMGSFVGDQMVDGVPTGVSWKDQQTALLQNPQWGPLARGVQEGTMDPGAAVKQAQALGATTAEIEYWARLLGYNGGEAGGATTGAAQETGSTALPGRTNAQQSGIVDWMSQARAGDQTAQYNLINSYGWQQAAQGNVNEAIDWLIRQGVDPKTAGQAASWVQANPNMWSGANATSAANSVRDAFNLTNTNLSGAGRTTFPTDYIDQVVRALLTGVPGPLSSGPTVGQGSIPWSMGTAPNVTSYGPGAGSMGLPGGMKPYELTGPGQVSGGGGGQIAQPGATGGGGAGGGGAGGAGGCGAGGGMPGGGGTNQMQAQASSMSPGLYTPGPGGGQTFNQLGPGVPWWYRNNPPQLYWPNQAMNQFPVWQNPWYGGPAGPFGWGPGSSGAPGAPGPAGTTGTGTGSPGISGIGGYPAGLSPEIRASYGPEAFGNLYGPVSAPSTGEGSGAGGETAGSASAAGSGSDASLASLASMGPYSAGISTPFGNFFGNTPGQNYGFSLAPGLGSGAAGQVVSGIMNALGIPGSQAGSFLANLGVAVAGTPLAGVVNTLAGIVSGNMQLRNANQEANLYALIPELARFGINLDDYAGMLNAAVPGQIPASITAYGGTISGGLPAPGQISTVNFGAGVLGGLVGTTPQGISFTISSPYGGTLASLNPNLTPSQLNQAFKTMQSNIPFNLNPPDPDPTVTGLTPADIDIATQAEQGETGGGPDGGPDGGPGGSPGAGTGGVSGGGEGAGDLRYGGFVRDRSRRKGGAEPITAHQGEFVVRPEATRRFAPILEWINNAPKSASTEQLMRFITTARSVDQRKRRT